MAAIQAMLCSRSLCSSPDGGRRNSCRGSARNLHLYRGINMQISRRLCICRSQSANKIDSLSPIIKKEKAELKKEGQLSPQISYLLDLGMELKSIQEICQKWPDLTHYNIDHKIQPITEFFIEKGFSIEELCFMLNKYGKLYDRNLEAHLVPKWEYFLTTDYPKLEIVKFPQYFTYSLEKRIKPRFERMKNCGVRLSLSNMLFHDDKKFDNFLQKEMGVFIKEEAETDDLNELSTISSSLLAAEREEAKAVLKLFLKKQGMSNALAARTINKSDSFIDYLVSKLHSLHKSRYVVGRELSTLEIRSALIPHLENLLEEHKDLLIETLEKFPEPPGTPTHQKPVSFPTNQTTLKEKAVARVTELDKSGNHLPQISYLLDLGMNLSLIKRICNKLPSFTYYTVEGKIKPFVDFLRDLGVPESEIPKIIYMRPQLCGMSLNENLIPTMEYLESVGVDKTQWAKVIYRFPALLTYSRQKMKYFVEFLSELGVPDENIGKILTRSPRIMSNSVEEKLRPVSEYFASLGVNPAILIQKCPQSFGLSIETNLKPVAEFFFQKGFSKEEFGMMINMYGAIYTLSLTENLGPKWDYFATMGYPKSELVKFPNYFGYNLEKRIKPRFERMRDCGVRLGLNRILSYKSSTFESLLKKKMDKLNCNNIEG